MRNALLLGLLIFVSCQSYTGAFRTIEKESFNISLPDWLEETQDLAPHAEFQFKSRYRNTYGILVKKPNEKVSFEHFQQNGMAVLRNYEGLTNLLVTDSTFKNDAYYLELMGDIESEKIFYWHNCYKSKNYYYELVLWTRSYDRKQKYTPVIEKIIDSFEIKE